MWSNKTVSATRILFLLLLICFPCAVVAQNKIQRGESTISGRVVFADTGRPVRRATVRLLTNLNYQAQRTTPANVRGEFRFNEVAAGTYFIVAETPGSSVSPHVFAITEFGTSADAESEPLSVSVDGKDAVRCEVRVVRGATIRGTILYPDKEPVAGAQISLLLRKNGATRPLITNEIYTNDRGMYRIDGLPEGEYLVGVIDTKKRLERQLDARDIVTAYYPGSPSITEAKSIQVQPGSDIQGINITLGDDDLRRISGVVKWRDGDMPAGDASVTLRRKEEPEVEASFNNLIRTITPPGANDDDTMFRDLALMAMSAPVMTETNVRGEWKFEDLPPGKYLITAYSSLSDKNKLALSAAEEELVIDDVPETSQERRRQSVSQQMELTVGDEDLKDVVIELSDGGRISGVIVAEESPVPNVRISAVEKGPDFLSYLFEAFNNAGTFVIEGVPNGDIRLEAQIQQADDLYIKSITLGSQDLMRNPIRMADGAEITGVRITVAKGLATLGGRLVFTEGGSPAGGGGVLLVKADPALWRLPSLRVFTVTNPAGEFTLKCAPGDYLVFTWPAGGQPMQTIQEFVQRNAASARRITLQSREEKRLDLTVAKPKK